MNNKWERKGVKSGFNVPKAEYFFSEMGEAKRRDPALLVLLQLQDW